MSSKLMSVSVSMMLVVAAVIALPFLLSLVWAFGPLWLGYMVFIELPEWVKEQWGKRVS